MKPTLPCVNCCYFQALREEEKQFAETKLNLREQIRDIRRTVSA